MKITRYAIKAIGGGFLYQKFDSDEEGIRPLSYLQEGSIDGAGVATPYLLGSFDEAEKTIKDAPSCLNYSNENFPYVEGLKLEDVEIVKVVLDFKL